MFEAEDELGAAGVEVAGEEVAGEEVAGEEVAGVEVGAAELGFSVSVTGHTVVPMTTVSVVTWPTGQSVTVGGHEVTV